MQEHSIGSESHNGFRKGDEVRVARLVDPESDEGQALFSGVVPEWLHGRSPEARGVVEGFLSPSSGRQETLIYVANPDYDAPAPDMPGPGCLAAYLVRELVHIG